MKKTMLISKRSVKGYKVVLTVLLFLLCQTPMWATNDFVFIYDASGNRIARTLVVFHSAKIKEENAKNKSELAIDSVLTNRITIYPNPTSGHLAIQITNLAETQKVSLIVMDLKGQVLMNKSGISSFTDLDITAYPSATYVLRIVLDGKPTEWKIIKQ